jgi:hypothetical protein
MSGDQSLYYNLMAIYWLFIGIVACFNKHFIIPIPEIVANYRLEEAVKI